MYRSIDTEVWDDTWFADLEPDAKLLFLYLLTNRRTTACGAFEISVRMIVNETGIDADRVEHLITSFHPRVLWFHDDNLIWVRNFFRRQYKNANEKQVAALRSALAQFPHIITTAFKKEYPQFFADDVAPPIAPDTPEIAYPEATDSLSIGVPPITITVEEEGTEPEKEQVSSVSHETARPRAPRKETTSEPFLVWSAGCEIAGVSIQDAADTKDRQTGKIKQLLRRYERDDLVGCFAWLHDDQFEKRRGIDWFRVEQRIDGYIGAGRPQARAQRETDELPEGLLTNGWVLHGSR